MKKIYFYMGTVSGALLSLLFATTTIFLTNDGGIPEAVAHTPNSNPVITTPTDGQVFVFEAGQGLGAFMIVAATDPDDGDFVNITNTPLPPGAFYEFIEIIPGEPTVGKITFQDGFPSIGTYEVTFTGVDFQFDEVGNPIPGHGASSSPVTVKIIVVPPDHLDIREAELTVKKKRVNMEIELEGNVLPTIERPPYGYAALTKDGKGILAVTTHAGILDSEDQADVGDSALHTHRVNVTFKTDCGSGIEVESASFKSPGTLELDDNEIEVKKAPRKLLGDFTDTIISFILTIEDGHICVNPVDSLEAEEEDD